MTCVLLTFGRRMAGVTGMSLMLAAPALAGDPSLGAKQFKKCKVCHTVEKGGKKKIGPNLWNIVGRDIGSVKGFRYSKALRKKKGTWTPDLLDRYIKSPRRVIRGTRMAFGGIRNDKQRKALITFLARYADKSATTKKKEAAKKTSDPKLTTKPETNKAAEAKRKRLAKLRKRGNKYVLKDIKLPPGAGREEMSAYCGACHSLRLVVQQGQTRAGWDELLDYMVEEQAMDPIPKDDRKLVLDYLAKHYGIKRKSRRRP